MKKEKAKGFQVQTGYPANHGASMNVNYRTGWINWFVNYGVSFRKLPGARFNDGFYFQTDTTYYIDQINDRNRESLSQNVRFGSDIYFNKKTSLPSPPPTEIQTVTMSLPPRTTIWILIGHYLTPESESMMKMKKI